MTVADPVDQFVPMPPNGCGAPFWCLSK